MLAGPFVGHSVCCVDENTSSWQPYALRGTNYIMPQPINSGAHWLVLILKLFDPFLFSASDFIEAYFEIENYCGVLCHHNVEIAMVL